MGYQFDFISDDRFGNNKEDLENWDKELHETFDDIDGVRLKQSPIRSLTFENGKIRQWRITYYIYKDNKNLSWNNIFGKINKIKISRYIKI